MAEYQESGRGFKNSQHCRIISYVSSHRGVSMTSGWHRCLELFLISQIRMIFMGVFVGCFLILINLEILQKTFSHNGRNTMQPTDKNARIGQRDGLSPGDIVQTRLMYDCPKPPCYEEFFKMEGNFTSPNYPIKYFKEHSCVWVIHVLPGKS